MSLEKKNFIIQSTRFLQIITLFTNTYELWKSHTTKPYQLQTCRCRQVNLPTKKNIELISQIFKMYQHKYFK